MDITTARVVIMLLSFAIFIGIVLWAWSSRRKKRFEEAANLPFADEEMHQRTIAKQRREAQSESSSAEQDTEHTS